MRRIKRIFAKRIFNPVYSLIQGKNSVSKVYKQFKKAQWNDIEENKHILAESLYDIIQYSAQNIPYYRRIVKRNKITFTKETIFEDIRKFQILTKQIIRKEFKNLYKIRDNTKWFYNTSGGSTGEPVRLIQDDYYEKHANAIKVLQKEWTGYQLGDGLIKLWGSQKEVFKEKEKMSERIKSHVRSIHLL